MPMLDLVSKKIWYGPWMTAASVAKTSIVKMMTHDELMQEQDVSAMMNMLVELGQGPQHQGAGPSMPPQSALIQG